MKLDYQEINHNHITRLIIFAVFLFKETRKQENVYFRSIRSFLKKRLPHDIEFTIEVGPKLPKDEQRDKVIDSILNEEHIGILNLVVINFKTGYKEVSIQIDLDREDKYENYLYS